MSVLPRKPYRPAWLVALGATILAIAAATVPHLGGAFDSSLSVLTLTLIAVIWYTYFTYQSINRFDPTFLQTSLSGMLHPAAIDLHPAVENRSANSIVARIILDIWIDDSRHECDAFYSGQEDIAVEPVGGFVGNVRIDTKHLSATGVDAMTGEPTSPTYRQVRVRMIVFWKDQLGERGQAGAKYYYARLDDAPAVGPIIATTRIVDLFGTLPNPADRPPGGWKALGKS